MSYAIKVVWNDGSEEFLKQGNQIARFANMPRAIQQRDFMKIGMGDDECQSINIVDYPMKAK